MKKNKIEFNVVAPDFYLLVAVYILLAIGISMLYSASINVARTVYKDQYYIFRTQLMWIGFGTIFLLAGINIKYQYYRKYSRIFIGIVLVLLIAVLFPQVGRKVSGSRSWIRISFFNIQPAELAKIILILYLATMFSKKRFNAQKFFEGYLPPLIITTVVFFLILLQPDFGSGFLLLTIAGVMFFISGIKIKYLLTTFFALLPVAYILIFNVGYRKMRLLTFLNPWSDPINKGYHIIQSIKSFRLGGIAGVGLGKGIQKLYYLPQPHTDFIYSVIGEEAGFIGTFIFFSLFLFMIYRGIKITLNTPDKFSFFISSGIVSMWSIQVFINIAVTLGLLPITGLPLPFVSYGGSSLIVNMLSVGIMLNISRFETVKKRSMEVVNVYGE